HTVILTYLHSFPTRRSSDLHQLRWHFLIACHHVKQTDHRDDGGVGCAQEEKEKDNANNPTKHFSESRTKADASKILADKAQHILDRKSTRLNSSHRTISYAV